MKLLTAIFLLMLSNQSLAACKSVWVDHDFNTSTPARRQQICDSAISVPAINTPTVRPIQRPQVKPISPIVVPPVGTTKCSNQSVYIDGKWVTKVVCS